MSHTNMGRYVSQLENSGPSSPLVVRPGPSAAATKIAQICQGVGFIGLAMWLIFANNSKAGSHMPTIAGMEHGLGVKLPMSPRCQQISTNLFMPREIPSFFVKP